jgi:ABC-2 type transport system ATP-binding protein
VGGRIVRVGSLEELMKEHQRETVLELSVEGRTPELAESLQRHFPHYVVHRQDARRLRVVTDGSIDVMPLLGILAEVGGFVNEARFIRPSLEEVFVRVTGIESEVMGQEREGKKL